MNIIHFIEFAIAVVFMKIFTNLIMGGFVGAIIGFLIGSAIVYGIHFLIVYIGRSIINSIKHWTLITFRYKNISMVIFTKTSTISQYDRI